MNILSAFLVGFLVAGGDPQLKEFTPPDKSCKVQFPGTPQERTAASGGRSFLLEEADGGYMLGYVDIVPKGEEDAVTQERLNGSRDAILKKLGAKLTKESKITLG